MTRALRQATKQKAQDIKGRRYQRQAEKHRATEAAVRMSKEFKVDLRQIEGTGADGRITAQDVRSARNGHR